MNNHTPTHIMAFNTLWQHPPTKLRLSKDDIHVWCASLDQQTRTLQQFEQTLSKNELGRAKRFYFDKDRESFIVRHGILRIVLSYYLGIMPGQLEFFYGLHGKPYLAKRFGGDTFRFNMAHSHKLALYAFSRCREIGIDTEYIKTISDDAHIAKRFFSACENAKFSELPARQKKEAFFNCWTRKEAFIKATGDGLSLPLNQFDVSLTPGEQVRLLGVKDKPEEVSRWSLAALIPAPDYVAALAVEGNDWHLGCWKFP